MGEHRPAVFFVAAHCIAGPDGLPGEQPYREIPWHRRRFVDSNQQQANLAAAPFRQRKKHLSDGNEGIPTEQTARLISQ